MENIPHLYRFPCQGPPGDAGPSGPPGPPGPPTTALEELFAVHHDYEFVEDDQAADPPFLPEMNQDEALPNKKSAVLRADTGVHATLKTLSGHMQNLRSPDGSKGNPAKTCQDIKQCYPQKKSGEAPVFCLFAHSFWFGLDQYQIYSIYSFIAHLKQVNTGLIQIKEAQKMLLRSSVIWKMVKPASPPTRPPFPAKPGGPNPVPASTNPSGLRQT